MVLPSMSTIMKWMLSVTDVFTICNEMVFNTPLQSLMMEGNIFLFIPGSSDFSFLGHNELVYG